MIFVYSLKLHRDQLRDTCLLHRHAVKSAGHLHRPLVVCDHDKLRVSGHLDDLISKAPNVRFVKWSVDLVERPKKPAPEGVLMAWAREWAKEGVAVDWRKLLPPKGYLVLPRRWVVERTLSWIDQQRRMSKDYERLCASGEALVYAAMIRLMTRRLVRV